jgi:hypothetical protein
MSPTLQLPVGTESGAVDRARARRRRFGLLAGMVLFAACDRESGPPAPPAGEVPAAQTQGEDAPIRALYVCGNRFVLINAQPFAVRVTWRVQGTDEQGEQALAPAPAADPEFSEIELTVQHEGPLALYRGDQLLAVADNERTACEPATGGPSFAVAASSTAGQWSGPTPMPIVAVHAHMLRTGKLLFWGKFGDPYVFTPSTGGFRVVPVGSLLFCSGHSFLRDGRLLVEGGHISDGHGLPDAHIFNPGALTWSTVKSMRRGRWYPTSTSLPNGEVLTIAGRDQNGLNVGVAEVWTGTTWRALSGASWALPYYPRTFVTSKGLVYYAGELKTTRFLNTSGTGSWTAGPSRLFGTRDYGAAVMYLPDKILYVGGGRTTATAETIDLGAASPVWRWTGSMAYPRRHLNATMLPTGEVLVTGGVGGAGFNDLDLAVRVAEIWNPTTGAWTQVASNAVNRGYHATSLLLPDGRVIHTGSGNAIQEDGVTPAPDEKTYELYSPPYLFKGARPSISSFPTSVVYGQPFTVGTAAAVSKVSLIAIGSTTHAFDMNQRFMWLDFTQTTGGITVTAPSSINIAPPGYYMLFILNANSVPSKGKLIRLH